MDRHLIEAAFEGAAKTNMEWGRDDCSLWVCNLITAATGVDLAKPLRGYRSRLGAARRLKAFAGGGLCEAALKIAATAQLKTVTWPWTGTLVGVVAGDNGPTLALFWNGVWLGRTENGCRTMPASFGVLAWELPKCRH